MATKPIVNQEFKDKAERLKALRSAASANNTKLGIKGVTRASDLLPYKRAQFNVPELDQKTGGLIHGAVTTIWGGQGAGKTTLALSAVAQAQREGKIVYWIALENFDPERALWAGCNLDELMIGQFPQAEQCLDTIIDYARRKFVDVIVLDSIHSMSPKGEQEDKSGVKSTADNTIGLLARKLSTFFPQALDPIKRADIACLFIGQTRIKITPILAIEHLSGGNALLHNSRLIMKLSRGPQDDAPRKISYIMDGEKKKKVEEVTGFPASFRIDKVQVGNCLPEKSVIQIPYYYESAFELPQYIKDENKEIEASTAPVVSEPKAEVPVEKITEPEVKVRKRGVSAKRKKG